MEERRDGRGRDVFEVKIRGEYVCMGFFRERDEGYWWCHRLYSMQIPHFLSSLISYVTI